MSTKTVVVCDGCGRTLERESGRFKLCLKTDSFWDGVEMDYNLIQLDFCPTCAREIKETLRRIAERLEHDERFKTKEQDVQQE
ncbi:MAG: hypothetical protein ACTSPB_17990 [Candidatus Thorarchaeota archaeon]